ncbi:MAG: glycerol-3-phosphate acyltransferase [Deltaproteobacteria bacterium]|nr:glycerol-3-phosphate acyltransferase [Deltaproteobacteria bacterium]
MSLNLNMLPETGLFIFLYICGSINFSIIYAKKIMKMEIRQTGSNNAGATNLMRLAGVKSGVMILIADILRAYLLMTLLKFLSLDELWPIGGLFIITGNIYPVFHSFKGGKGVANTIGIFLAIFPITLSIGLIIFLAAVLITRRVSMGSLTLVISVFIIETAHFFNLLHLNQNINLKTVATAAIIMIMVIWSHRNNIERLIKGKEPATF